MPMNLFGIPVTDDHIHIDPVNGRGIDAAREFRRAGGTHLFLVTKPSWSYGIDPVTGEDYREIYDRTLKVAAAVRETGVGVFVILGIHPAEITRLAGRMTLDEAESLMKGGLEVAREYVGEQHAVALKSGRPHYPVDSPVWEASNRILSHAIMLAKDCGCAVQIHAETGPCSDVADLARSAGFPVHRVVKHFGSPDTPLTPSLIARSEAIPHLSRSGRLFTMESDFMDENSRPGAVLGPKSVPRFTRKLIEGGLISIDEAYRIHATAPSAIYGVEIELP
jgi:TatD-related deoxyribonuclease